MKRRRGSCVLSALVLAAATFSVAGAEEREVGARPAADSPEAGLWVLSDKAESEAKRSAELNTSAELREYVRSVACKVAATHCPEIRVYVFDRPFFQASMAPNGYMEVWSGLMLRAESEAELAFVLGHETGHYVNSHSWQSLQAVKSRATGAMFATVLIGVAGAVASVNAGSAAAANGGSAASAVNSINSVTSGLINAVYLGTVASLFSFSREHETIADAFGYDAAVKAGYQPSAGVALWQRLIDETAASDFPKVRNGQARTSVFDSHPVAADRVAALNKLAGDQTGGEEGKARYRAAIRPFLGPWLRDDLRRRDFGQSLFLIDRLGAGGEDLGVINFYRGEALRLRRKDGDAAAAEAAYREAIRFADAPPETWRQLADFAERRGDHAETARLLQTFLDKAPNAGDAAFARMRLARALGAPAPEVAPLAAPDPVAPPGSPVPVAVAPSAVSAALQADLSMPTANGTRP
ncbi:MAG TPA: M48 family metalloprotease [Caulobacterales bacterium]|nr:M48 family metalloprotease [Caulobacterales bacterium]